MEISGAALIRHRKYAGLSRSALAEKAGVTRETIRLIEVRAVRTPRDDTIAALARAIGCKIADLYETEAAA